MTTEQEAFEAWFSEHPIENQRPRNIWRAALEWARTQQEPVAWLYELAYEMNLGGYCDWRADVSTDNPNVPKGAIRNLRPLYLAPVAKAEWRPIETAPKDTALLLYCGWMYSIGHFNTALCEWVECFDHRKINPTGWMPLPAAPEYKGES